MIDPKIASLAAIGPEITGEILMSQAFAVKTQEYLAWAKVNGVTTATAHIVLTQDPGIVWLKFSKISIHFFVACTQIAAISAYNELKEIKS